MSTITIVSFLSTLIDFVFPKDPLREAARHAKVEDFRKTIDRYADKETGIISYFHYRDSLVRNAIHELKYHRFIPLAGTLAEAVYEDIIADVEERLILPKENLVTLIPVPLSKKKFRSRDFNQCELIAKEIQKRAPDFFSVRTDIIERSRDTESQTSLPDNDARRRNVSDAFSISLTSQLPSGLIVVLDDVTTTGSTLKEVEKTLRVNGARDILLIALAR